MGRPANFDINAAHPLARGLVFAGLSSGGSTRHYYDSGPYKNICILLGTKTLRNQYIPTLGRNAYYFNGVNTVYTMPMSNIPSIIDTNKITVTGWLFLHSVGRNAGVLTTTPAYGGPAGLRLKLAGEVGGTFDMHRYSKNSKITMADTAANTVTINQWIFFCCMSWGWETTGQKILLNNQIVPYRYAYGDAGFDTHRSLDGMIRIGDSGVNTRYLHGYLADLMIWNRILTIKERAILGNRYDYTLGGLIV